MRSEGPDSVVDKARSAVERTVTESWKIPQFWAQKRVVLDSALAWLGSDESPSASLSDVIVWACAQGLREHPELLPDGAAGGDDIPITYLVAGPTGLMAPALGVAAGTGLAELAEARRGVVERARSGRLAAADARPGAFTVSNLGPAGVDSFSALVLPGQRAILAVGSHRHELRLVAGEPREATVMDLVLSVDHRHVDGTQSAAFLVAVQGVIEGLAEGSGP